MARANENPWHVVVAKDRRGNVLQATFCDTLQAARDVTQASIRHGQFWWADHETIEVPRPLTASELAYMVAA